MRRHQHKLGVELGVRRGEELVQLLEIEPEQQLVLPLGQQLVLPLGQQLGQQLVLPLGQQLVLPLGQQLVLLPEQQLGQALEDRGVRRTWGNKHRQRCSIWQYDQPFFSYSW